MAFTQEYVPDVKKLRSRDHLSALMKAKEKCPVGEVVNFCPWCEDNELDDNGYCRHLIGFTNDGKLYEPMVQDGEYRKVKVDRPKIPMPGTNRFSWGPAKLPEVLKTDKLVRITCSSRVYRNVDEQPNIKTAVKAV